MNILKQKQIFFNRINQHVPKQLRRLFLFGYYALVLQNIVSIRGNARIVETNFNTAKQKAYRLTSNNRWLQLFPTLLSRLDIVSDQSIVALDFSTFKQFQILTFALQTKRGRAIPIYFEIITYPIKKDSQNIFVAEAIERFVKLVGCRPKIVMDRGFACPYVIKCLSQQSHLFIVRIKGMKQLTDEEKRLIFKAREAESNDIAVTAYGYKLRLIVSDNPGNGNEPWYLITNDFVSVRNGVINDYYRRFEIEEFFKDAKWLQGLEHLHFQKTQSMSVVLWFVILGWWFMVLLEKDTSVIQGKHAHDKLSYPRLITEAIMREQMNMVEYHMNVCMGGKREVVYV